MIINGFELVNEEKVNRAIHGSVGKGGALVGGKGVLDNGELTNPDQVLAEYDRLGGLIRKDGQKVKMGSFYDFKLKAQRPEPEVVLLYQVNGEVVEVPEGAELPGEVKAVKILAESKAKKEKAKKDAE